MSFDWSQFDEAVWAQIEGTWNDLGRGPLLLFQPPAQLEEVPRTLAGMSEADHRYWSHFRRGAVGRNLYKKTDGTYTTFQPPDDEIAHIYFGGHIEVISEEEATRLEAAGYQVQQFTPEPF